MPAHHGCFRCGAVLDDTCGKDAEGRWLCGSCWDKRGVVNAKIALQNDTHQGLQKVRRWQWIVLAILSALGVGRMLLGGRRRRNRW